MFFVVGSGRSGTKTAAHTFSQFKNCFCLHEPAPALVVEATEYYLRKHGQEKVIDVLRSSRKPFVDGKIYGEANQQLTLLIPILNEVFPQAQYIWLIRDGRDAVASMYYRGWYDRSQTRIPEEWHRGRLQGDRTGDFSASAWANLSRFERCCWIWKKYNLISEAELALLDRSRWSKVQLEKLKASLDDLSTWLGLKPRRRLLVEKHNIAFQPVIQWELWTPGQRAQFEQHCGKEMDRWYPQWRSADGKWQPIEKEEPDRPGRLFLVERLLAKKVRRVQTGFKKAMTGIATRR